jgi:gliding motility-associated-like protein
VGETTILTSSVSGGTWSSSDTTVATIDAATGELSSVSNGNTTITYTVTGSGTCLDSSTIQVVVNQLPTITIQAGCNGTDFEAKAITQPTSGVTYEWYDGSSTLVGTSPSITITQQGSYTVVVKNNGCENQATYNVTNVYCDIPRGISPNGDNLNDYFDLSNLNVSKLQIFNRYGVEVYSENNYKKEWNGKTNSGQELPDATYYYLVKFENGKSKSGWVYINRER